MQAASEAFLSFSTETQRESSSSSRARACSSSVERHSLTAFLALPTFSGPYEAGIKETTKTSKGSTSREASEGSSGAFRQTITPGVVGRDSLVDVEGTAAKEGQINAKEHGETRKTRRRLDEFDVFVSFPRGKSSPAL
jgi:hypothetical protein